jgi:predicted dienelactone hydrolase
MLPPLLLLPLLLCPFFSTHLPVVQAGFMLKFVEQLQAVAENPNNPLHGKIDFINLGAAGHSRGAKIAAMHFAGGWICQQTFALQLCSQEFSADTCANLARCSPRQRMPHAAATCPVAM